MSRCVLPPETPEKSEEPPRAIYTIGHSTRTIDDFIETLRSFGVRCLVDIRTVPGSRRNPQFGQESLRDSLQAAGADYIHMKALGGLRRSKGPSPRNAGWTHEAFRSYADYANSPEFEAALDELLGLAGACPAAIMCAEAVPWRCHRRIVADHLVLVRGWRVLDIMDASKVEEHKVTEFATLSGKTVYYPAAQLDMEV